MGDAINRAHDDAKHTASLQGGDGASASVPVLVSSSDADGSRVKFTLLPKIRGRQTEDKEGKLWEVRVIEAGDSLNGLNYTPETLKEAAPLFEGVPVYAYRWGDKVNHLSDEAKAAMPRGHVGNLVGRIQKSWWNEEDQAIDALLAVHDQPTRTLLKNAHDAGDLGDEVEEPLLGLSIDAAGLKAGGSVSKIVRPESLDLVTTPAAGGKFKRLVAAMEDSQQEDEMKPEEIEAIVAKVMGVEMVKLTEQVVKLKEAVPPEPPAQPAAPADLISELRKLLQEANEEDRKAFASRIVAMLKEAGLIGETEDKFAQITAGVQSLVESKPETADDWAKGIAALAEEHMGDKQTDLREERIKLLESTLRKNAIGRALEKIGPELKIRDLDAATRLMDVSEIKVSGDYSEVTGLKESLKELIKTKTYLVEEEADPKDGVKPGEGTLQKKPEPRGQEIRLIEEQGGNGSPDLKAIEARLAQVIPFASDGDDHAITEMSKLIGQRTALLA